MLNLNWPWHIAHSVTCPRNKCQKCSIPQATLWSLSNTTAEATSLPLYCRVLFRDDHDVHAVREMKVFGNLATTWTTSFPSMSSVRWRSPYCKHVSWHAISESFNWRRTLWIASLGPPNFFDRLRRDSVGERWRAGLPDRSDAAAHLQK